MNAPQCYVTRTLPFLFGHNIRLRIVVKFVPVDLKTTSSNSVSRFTIYFYLRTKFNMFTSNLPLLTSTETKARENICRVVTAFYNLDRYCIFRVSDIKPLNWNTKTLALLSYLSLGFQVIYAGRSCPLSRQGHCIPMLYSGFSLLGMRSGWVWRHGRLTVRGHPKSPHFSMAIISVTVQLWI